MYCSLSGNIEGGGEGTIKLSEFRTKYGLGLKKNSLFHFLMKQHF
jgi:hypothetical protein